MSSPATRVNGHRGRRPGRNPGCGRAGTETIRPNRCEPFDRGRFAKVALCLGMELRSCHEHTVANSEWYAGLQQIRDGIVSRVMCSRIAFLDMTDLEGRVIAIAGAGGGLGPIVAQRLADAGASLALADRQPGDRRRRRPGPRSPGRPRRPPRRRPPRRIRRQRLGRRDPEEVRPRRRPPPPRRRLPRRRPHPQLRPRRLRVPPRPPGPHPPTHHPRLPPALTASDHGRFVLVSAAAAQMPENTNAAYASAKAAAEAWTLALADSFDGTNATANIIVVNAIETPQIREYSPGRGAPHLHPGRGPRRRHRLPLLGLRGPHERPAPLPAPLNPAIIPPRALATVRTAPG